MNWVDFPGHEVVLETSRLRLRPFLEQDFDVALGYYADQEFLQLMDGDFASFENFTTRRYWIWRFVDLTTYNSVAG